MRAASSRRPILILALAIALLASLLPASLGAAQARPKLLPKRVPAAHLEVTSADTSGGGTVTVTGVIAFQIVNGRCVGSFVLRTPVIPYYGDSLEAIVPCPIGFRGHQQRSSLMPGDTLTVSFTPPTPPSSTKALLVITVTGPSVPPVWFPPIVLRFTHNPRALVWRPYVNGRFIGAVRGISRNGLYQLVNPPPPGHA